MSRFSERDWHYILSDVSSVEQFHEMLQMESVHGLVAYNIANEPVAFAMLIDEPDKDNKVSIHGGCWSAGDSYEAIITLIEILFSNGKAVRSSCTIDNQRATHFLRKLGFVNHYTSEQYRHFWLPYKRFVNSAIYKRLHQ